MGERERRREGEREGREGEREGGREGGRERTRKGMSVGGYKQKIESFGVKNIYMYVCVQC